MRQVIKDFIKISSETLPIVEPIYEFGALQVPGQSGFADLRPFFEGKEYLGCDLEPGPGVDRILNLHSIDLPSESVGLAIIADTLEHVEYFREAIQEVYRILKPNGILLISSVMNFAIHNFPHDYWRFTPEGFKSMLSIFPVSIVEFAGKETFPHTIVGVACKDQAVSSLNEFQKRICLWKQRYEGQKKDWKYYMKMFIPPVIVSLYRALRNIKPQWSERNKT